MMQHEVWSEARQARLVELATTGKTAREVAALMGTTRNAILGRAHRTGVLFGGARRAPPAGGFFALSPEKRSEIAKTRGRTISKHALTARAMGYKGCSFGRLKGEYIVARPIIIAALAAVFCGLSAKKAAAANGVSAQSITKVWMKDPALRSEARMVALRAKAQIEANQRSRRMLSEAREAERAKAQAANNAPVLAKLSVRHRDICERLLAGATLQAVADHYGITRERVRQIVTIAVNRYGLDVNGRFGGKVYVAPRRSKGEYRRGPLPGSEAALRIAEAKRRRWAERREALA